MSEINMSTLNDDVLLNILLRFPDRRSLSQCSMVCKRWYSLLSKPNIRENFYKKYSDFHVTLFGCLATPLIPRYELFSNRLDTTLHGGDHQVYYYLDFLPCGVPYIRASCEDLLLVSYSPCEDPEMGLGGPWLEKYCICNPITREWVELPEAPEAAYKRCGFVCEFKNRSDKGLLGCSNNIDDQYRSKVLLIKRYFFKGNKYVFSGVIFCSETRKWSPSTFSISWALDHGFMFPSDFVTNNGNFYSLLLNDFGHKVKGIVAFDPFIDVTSDDEDDIPKRCHFIHLPIDFCHRWKGKVCFGVVQVRLRLSQLLKFKGDFVLKIWELNDKDSGGDWLLVHHVRLTSAKTYKMRVAAFHPNNGNVIFMLHNSEREIYRYEIGEEKFAKIGRLPSPVSELSNFYICSPALLCIFRGLHCTTSENKKVERLAKYWRIRHA